MLQTISQCEPKPDRWRWVGVLLLKCIFAPGYSAHVDASCHFCLLHFICLYSYVDSDLSVTSSVWELQEFSVKNSFPFLFIRCQTVAYTKVELCAKNSSSGSHCSINTVQTWWALLLNYLVLLRQLIWNTYTNLSHAKRNLQKGFIEFDNLYTVKQVDGDYSDGTQLEWVRLQIHECKVFSFVSEKLAVLVKAVVFSSHKQLRISQRLNYLKKFLGSIKWTYFHQH